MMLSRTFRYLYYLILKLFAWGVLVAAVVVTVVRLVLPEIGSYREEVRTWLDAYMGHPVAIADINANWDAWLPELKLHQLRILDRDLGKPVLDFDTVLIRIDVFKSILNGEIIPRSITISDVRLDLMRRKDGSVAFANKRPDASPGNSRVDRDVLVRWVLAQKHLVIEHARITIFDQYQDNRTLQLPDVTLHMKNDVHRTQIDGSISLPTAYGESLKFALDASGDMLTRDWSGEIYLEAMRMDASLLLTEVGMLGSDVRTGVADMKIWGTWDQARLRQVDGQITLRKLQAGGQQTPAHIDHMAGRFTTTLMPDNEFHLVLALDEMTTPYGGWPRSTIVVRKIYDTARGGHRYRLQADYLKLVDVQPILSLFVGHVDDLKMLLDLNLVGVLGNSVIKYDPALPFAKGLHIASDFRGVSARLADGSFNVHGLSGFLRGLPERGSMEIATDATTLEAGGLLTQPLTLYELSTDLAWRREADHILIETPSLRGHTEDFDLHARGRLKFFEAREFPWIDLLIKLSDGQADRVTKYLFAGTPTEVVHWLDEGLVSGEVTSVVIAFRGAPNDFPFDERQGVFQGHARLKGVSLKYDPAWPLVNDIDADVVFDQQSLAVHARTGNFLGTTINGAHMTIADYTSDTIAKTLAINGRISGTFDDASRLIMASPLHKIQFLRTLASYGGVGDLELDLGLNIPIAEGAITFDGMLRLDHLTVDFADDPVLSGFEGSVHFTEDSIIAMDIDAHYFDHPVELALTRDSETGMALKLSGDADGRLISTELVRHFPALAAMQTAIKERIRGSCRWQLAVNDLRLDRWVGDKLVLTSSLEGLAVDLPAPLAKSFEPVPLEIEISTPPDSDRRRRIAIHYAGDRDSVVIDDRGGQRVVTGHIDQLAMDEWFKLLSVGMADPTDGDFDPAIPLEATLETKTLTFADYHFPKARLSLTGADADRRLNLSADDVSGEVHIRRTIHGPVVEIDFRTLNLIDTADAPGGAAGLRIMPAAIPPLDIDIADLTYHMMPLGRMILKTSKIDGGLAIDHMSFEKSDVSINGTGRWYVRDGDHRSEMNLEVEAASMQAMLETFRYDMAAVQDAKTKLTLDAGWLGTLADFSLGQLSGTVAMDIGQGRFTEIGSSTGRFFGLLSLQALPRRLSLDFSDLFGKGLAFDRIMGDFDIGDGDAHTNNLTMHGPTVHISIQGRTGLVVQDYDQLATVTPKIADSLPVAGTFLGPVGVGVGAAIFLTGQLFRALPDTIDTLLQAQYSIGGTWENPEITKISQNTEPQAEFPKSSP